jgi:hypothetical protein
MAANNKVRSKSEKRAPRFQKYLEPPREVLDAQLQSAMRVKQREQKVKAMDTRSLSTDGERDKYAKLIGQLKAAEARSRLRILRLRYEANRGDENAHLIGCQANAIEALRLEAFLMPPTRPSRTDPLTQFEV